MRGGGGDDPNRFLRWEEELPSPEELMPISHTLITPRLALAFQIATPPPPPPLPPPPSMLMNSDLGGDSTGGDSTGEEQARTLKRPRLVWTPQLHKRFVDAVSHLGIENAVPKTIMQLMSVQGLTRENVASHLQKYRLYLRRMQVNNGNRNGNGGHVIVSDSATDRLFASSPVPVRVNSEYLMNMKIRNMSYEDSDYDGRKVLKLFP